MVIKSSQMEAFRENEFREFRQELLEHARNFAPQLAAVCGTERLRQVVTGAVAVARDRGLTLRGPIRLFLECKLMFGSGFESDPLCGFLTWRSKPNEDEMSRAMRIHGCIHAYFDRVAGPDDEFAKQALQRLHSGAFLSASIGSGKPSEREIRNGLEEIYPEKFAEAGETAIHNLIREAREHAERYGLPAEAGTALLSGMSFGFGHLVVEDLLYPWVGSVLTDPLIRDGAGRLERLRSRATVYTRKILEFWTSQGNA